MEYIEPNFTEEWNEAKRYSCFKRMGMKRWVEYAQNNYEIDHYKRIKNHLTNVDLDFESLEPEKKERFEKAFHEGKIELPMVIKFAHDDYELMGGNTRTAGLVKHGINPKMWIINGDRDSEMSMKEDKLKGGKSDTKTLEDIAKKHDKKGYYHVDDMVKSLKKQVEIGLPFELEHTDNKEVAMEIVKDHLWEDPSYYTKLKKAGIDEDKQFSPPPHETETYDSIMGKKHSKHNPYDEDDDKDDVFPTGSSDWRKKETKELWVRDEDPIDGDIEDPDDDDKKPKPKPKKHLKETGADSSGAFEAGAFGQTILKRDLHKLKNLPNAKKYQVTEKETIEEQMTADVSAGASYDVPLFGKTPKGGRKDPLAIEGPKSIAKSRAVTDPKFPKWGGPGGVFIKIKEKCKKFPYCNQGDINAIEPLREAISKASEKYGIPRQDVEKIVINEINKIFINYESERTR